MTLPPTYKAITTVTQLQQQQQVDLPRASDSHSDRSSSRILPMASVLVGGHSSDARLTHFGSWRGRRGRSWYGGLQFEKMVSQRKWKCSYSVVLITLMQEVLGYTLLLSPFLIYLSLLYKAWHGLTVVLEPHWEREPHALYRHRPIPRHNLTCPVVQFVELLFIFSPHESRHADHITTLFILSIQQRRKQRVAGCGSVLCGMNLQAVKYYVHKYY